MLQSFKVFVRWFFQENEFDAGNTGKQPAVRLEISKDNGLKGYR